MQNRSLISDERAILMAADALGTSHPCVFELAYRDWYGTVVPERDLAHAFERYLFAGEVPCWVRAFTRNTLAQCEEAGVDMTLTAKRHNVTPGVTGMLGRLVKAGQALWSH